MKGIFSFLLFFKVSNRLLNLFLGTQMTYEGNLYCCHFSKWVWPKASLQGPLSRLLKTKNKIQVGLAEGKPSGVSFKAFEDKTRFFQIGLAEGKSSEAPSGAFDRCMSNKSADLRLLNCFWPQISIF